MFVCESEFLIADPKTPNYSMTEVDFYSHIPYGFDFPQHRLSLRKNLKTGEYEAVRAFQKRTVTIKHSPLTSVLIDSGTFTGEETVAFKDKDLSKVLAFLNAEVKKFWGKVHGKWEPDELCQHKPPKKNTFCKIWDNLPINEKVNTMIAIRKGAS